MVIYFVRMLWYNELELYILVLRFDIIVIACIHGDGLGSEKIVWRIIVLSRGKSSLGA